jgi:hypothetical protein
MADAVAPFYVLRLFPSPTDIEPGNQLEAARGHR